MCSAAKASAERRRGNLAVTCPKIYNEIASRPRVSSHDLHEVSQGRLGRDNLARGTCMLGRTLGCVRRNPAVSLHGSPTLLPAPLATRTLVLTFFCPPRTVYNHHLLSVTHARCVCLARRSPVTVLALALFSLCLQGCFFVWWLGVQPRRVLPLSTPTPRASCRGARMRGRAVWDCRTEVWAPSSGTYFLLR